MCLSGFLHLKPHQEKEQASMRFEQQVTLVTGAASGIGGTRGARLVSLSPGLIQTPMGQQELDQQPIMRMLLAKTPLKRQGTPKEIAHAVDFLLSTKASFITDCDLLVDGVASRGTELRIVEGALHEDRFVAAYYEEGERLVAVLGWNSPKQLLIYRQQLLEGNIPHQVAMPLSNG
jgi:enoyl-ACP reductase-like protein